MDLEWEQRKRLIQGAGGNEADQQPEWTRCAGNEVMNRNRYANVDPYQNNRVKLKVPVGHSDYINASPIVLESTTSKKVTKFIATQVRASSSSRHIYIGTNLYMFRAPSPTATPTSGVWSGMRPTLPLS